MERSGQKASGGVECRGGHSRKENNSKRDSGELEWQPGNFCFDSWQVCITPVETRRQVATVELWLLSARRLFRLTNKRTPWRRILTESLTVAQLAKGFICLFMDPKSFMICTPHQTLFERSNEEW